METKTEWMDCGEGILQHPVTGRSIKTSVVELKGFGRIFEVYDYSNEPNQNFRTILAGPEMLSALEAVFHWWTHTEGFKNGEDEMPAEIFDDIRHSIAKAKGTK